MNVFCNELFWRCLNTWHNQLVYFVHCFSYISSYFSVSTQRLGLSCWLCENINYFIYNQAHNIRELFGFYASTSRKHLATWRISSVSVYVRVTHTLRRGHCATLSAKVYAFCISKTILWYVRLLVLYIFDLAGGAFSGGFLQRRNICIWTIHLRRLWRDIHDFADHVRIRSRVREHFGVTSPIETGACHGEGTFQFRKNNVLRCAFTRHGVFLFAHADPVRQTVKILKTIKWLSVFWKMSIQGDRLEFIIRPPARSVLRHFPLWFWQHGAWLSAWVLAALQCHIGKMSYEMHIQIRRRFGTFTRNLGDVYSPLRFNLRQCMPFEMTCGERYDARNALWSFIWRYDASIAAEVSHDEANSPRHYILSVVLVAQCINFWSLNFPTRRPLAEYFR